MTGRNMRPHVTYFTNWPPLRLRWVHYFRMRDHGSSLFSAVKNLHFFAVGKIKFARIFQQIVAFTYQLFQVHEADGVHITSRVHYLCERGRGLYH